MPDFETLTLRVKGEASGAERMFSKLGASAKRWSSGMASENDKVSKSFGSTADSVEEVTVNMTDFQRVGAATVASLPTLIAGVGGIVPVATAAAQGVAGLGTAVGAGAAGFALFGGAAMAAAKGGLSVYMAAVSSTVTASREAYLAQNKQVEKQLEQYRATKLNTDASNKFNEAVTGLTKTQIDLQAAVGERVFPAFTRWIGYLQENAPQMRKPFLGMISDVTMLADSFVEAQMHGEKFQNILLIMMQVRTITASATVALVNMASAGLKIAPMILAPASRLTDEITALTTKFYDFTHSAEGMNAISRVLQYMENQMYKLGSVAGGLIQVLINVGTAMGWAKVGSDMLTGLDNGVQKLEKMTEAGSSGAKALSQIGEQSGPILKAMGGLLGTIASEAGKLVRNLMGAKDAATGMNPIIPVLDAIAKSIAPVRRLIQNTFIDLAPALAKLIPELARLAESFAGSSKAQVAFLNTVARMLNIFNNLPDPVKNVIVELVAWNMIMKSTAGVGIAGMIKSIIGMVFQLRLYRAVQAASNKETAASGTIAMLAAAKQKAAAAAMVIWTGAVKAAVVAGRVLRVVMFTMLGPWGLLIAAIVLGAVLIYKNWDKIKKWAGQLWNFIKMVWGKIRDAIVAEVKQSAKQAVANFMFLKNGVIGIFNAVRNFVVGIVKSIGKGIVGGFDGARDGAIKAVTSLGNGARKLFDNIRDGISDRITKTRKNVVDTVDSMRKGAADRIDALKKGAHDKFDDIRKGVSDRVDTMRKNVVEFVDNMREGASNKIEDLKQGAHARFDEIRKGVTDRVDSMRKGVVDLVDKMREGVAALFEKMKKGGQAFGEGFKKIVVNAIEGAVNMMRKWLGAAALGLSSLLDKLGVGPAEELRDVGENLQEPLKFARGGIAMGDKPYMAGEQGEKEAIVNLDRRTPESARAARHVARRYPEAFGADTGHSASGHKAAVRKAKRGGKAGGGDAYGPTMSTSVLIPEMQEIAKKVKAKFSVSANTYSNHPPGYKQPFYRERSVDFWGPGGRGDAIGSYWPQVADYAKSLAGNAVNWILNPGNDAAHAGADAHVHMTAFAGVGQGKGTSGSSGGIDVLGMFSKFANSLAAFPSGGIMDLFSGLGTNVLGWMKDAVWEWAKDMAMSILPGGSSPKGLTIGEALSQSGWPDNQLIKGSSTIWHESRGNAKAQNPSGARGLMQIMPGTARGVGASYDKLYDPLYNTATGLKVFNQAGGWGPWVGAGMGGDYRNKPVTGYATGGVVPGRKGSEALIMAHAGERVLPERIARAFDHLAERIDRLDQRTHRNRSTDLAQGRADRDRERELLRRIERKLERQLEKMATKDELKDAFVTASAAFNLSPGGRDIVNGHVAGQIKRAKELAGKYT